MDDIRDSLSSTTPDKLRANLLLRRMRTTAATKYDVEISLDNFVAATHVRRSARLIRDDPTARTIADGKISSWEYAPILSIPLMHLTPNPCCQTEMGQLPHRARSIIATNSDVENFLDDFVAPVQAAPGAPDSRRRSLRSTDGVRPAPWAGGREPPPPRRWSKARSGSSTARLIADCMISSWEYTSILSIPCMPLTHPMFLLPT